LLKAENGDLPINEKAGIFTGVNILEAIFRNIEQQGAQKGLCFLASSLNKYSLKVIKVRNRESEDERQFRLFQI